jgi:dephospho-CoA kinase
MGKGPEVERQEARDPQRIRVIGIVGGVGSGKSALARWVAEHHPVAVIDADKIGHEVLQLPEVIAKLRQTFGDQILDAGGQIQRSALAAQVFGDDPAKQAAKRQLEAIVHPEIQREIEKQIASVDCTTVECVLLDAAVLLEAGWRGETHGLIFIDAPIERRREWVAEKRGWSAEELARRERSQWPIGLKQQLADRTVRNDGSIEIAGKQLWDAVSEEIKSPLAGNPPPST